MLYTALQASRFSDGSKINVNQFHRVLLTRYNIGFQNNH